MLRLWKSPNTAYTGPPHELQGLFRGETSVSKHFLSNIRILNAAMSMASMKARDETVNGGASYVRISGVVYRMVGFPRSAENSEPVSLQTYFYDAEQQLQYRMKLYPPSVNKLEIERTIFRTLKECNECSKHLSSIVFKYSSAKGQGHNTTKHFHTNSFR